MTIKDRQSQEYAEKKDRALRKAWHIYRYGEIKEGDDWENDPIKPFGNFEEGFNAGVSFFEQSQWCSVEEELPEIPNGKKMIRVFAWISDEPLVRWYTCHGRFITTLAAKERYSYDCMAKVKVHLSSEREDVTEIVTHWMPIPPIPDTKTEKKCGLATSNK